MKNVCYGKEFNALYDGVLVELSMDFDKYFPKKSKSGVLRPQGSAYRQDAGDFEEAKKIIFHGEVISAGPKCQMVKVGDEVFIDIRSTQIVPVQFGDEPVVKLSEQNIITLVTTAKELEDGKELL